MQPARVLARLAYRAYASGAHKDATTLLSIALGSEGADKFFLGEDEADETGEPNILDQEAAATSPLATPGLDVSTEDVEDEDNRLSSLLENGHPDAIPNSGVAPDQTGYRVKGFLEKLEGITLQLELLGLSAQSHEISKSLR